jgi:hypothetical protein
MEVPNEPCIRVHSSPKYPCPTGRGRQRMMRVGWANPIVWGAQKLDRLTPPHCLRGSVRQGEPAVGRDRAEAERPG